MLARTGHIVLADGNYPDYSWMVEGIEDELATMTDAEIDDLVDNHADAYDAYNVEGLGVEPAEDWEVEQAKEVLRKLRDSYNS